MEKNKVVGNISNVGNVKIGDEIHQHYNFEKLTYPKALTAKIPKTSQDKIVGREAELDNLHRRLFDNKQVVLVNGLGGIGKTTLAQVYVSKYWEEYRHIAWISRMSEDIINDFLTSEGLLDNLKIQRQGKDPKTLFINIVTKLNDMDESPNLLVIDNADASLCNLYDYLPVQPLWHILVTSRERIQKFDLKELGFLSEGKAIELFLKHYNRGDIAKDEIKELVKIIDYHTLTIEILAKTAQNQRTGINQLKRAIEDDLKANVFVDHKGDKIEKVTSYLCSIFSISKLNEKEIWLLKQFVCLPAEFHTYKILEELIKPEENKKEDTFSETLEELSNKGWLLHNIDTDSYKIHIIIAEVIKKQQIITLSDVEFLITTVSQKLRIDETKENPVNKFKWIPYGKSILDIFTDSIDNIISTLQNNLALVLQHFGEYKDSKILFGKAISSAEQNLGDNHPLTAIRYSNLALVLQDLGDYKGAKILLEKVICIDEKNFGTEHPNVAVSYSNLATIFIDLGDYEEAKNLLEKAVKSAEKYFGTEHPITTNRYSNLAMVFKALGDYEVAKKLLIKVIIADEKNFGIEHPTTAMSYTNLANVLEACGDYEEAKKLLEKSMISDEKNFGTERPSTMKSYSNLAIVLYDLCDYKGAEKLLEKVIRFDEKNFGAEHPTTAVHFTKMALVLKNLGNFEEAKNLLEKAILSDEKTYGIEHPTTANRYSNYATVLIELGYYRKALRFSEKAARIFKKVLPPNHPYIKISNNNYLSIKKQVKQFRGK